MKRKDRYTDSDVLDVDLFIDQTTPILEDEEILSDIKQNLSYVKKVSREMKKKTDMIEDLHLVAGKGPQVWRSALFLYLLTVDVKILSSVCVSSGCLCYGMCVAFSSSANTSLLNNNNTVTINLDQATWTSQNIKF